MGILHGGSLLEPVGGIANVGSYVIGHYAKHKTLKGMNYKRLGKDFLWG